MTFLPEIFLQQMKELLPSGEFEAFCKTYEEPTVRGLRFNRLKSQPVIAGLTRNLHVEDCKAKHTAISTNETSSAAFRLEIAGQARNDEGYRNDGGNSIPWCPDGTLYPETERPAKSIFYHTGLFYIQEPSAMCPVEVLKPEPGHRVLDLCAAPGGKSSQIAGFLQGQGLLVANDASPTRSRALVNNLERMGVTNAVITTELPKKLADRFPEFFDRILIDAPCSGEGMFRRDADAVKAYTANKPAACVAMQQEILRYAAKMLKPGGRLVYSTCTFNMQENEEVICGFLESNSDFAAVHIDHHALGISPGLGNLPQAGRIFPHRATGEGHFLALLERVAGANINRTDEQPSSVIAGLTRNLQATTNKPSSSQKPRSSFIYTNSDSPGFISHNMKIAGQARNDGGCRNDGAAVTPPPKEFSDFCRTHLTCQLPTGIFISHGANLYLQPEPLDLRGIRVARSGWFLGESAKGRFVPSWALAMGLRKQDVCYAVELSEEDAFRYLRGESLNTDLAAADKPYVMMCYENYPLGWARLVQGRLKNCLPVGLVTK